jgi:hypothetical protein
MFVMDVPNIPPQYAPMMIAQAVQAQGNADKSDRTVGVCSLVENPMRYTGINGIGPIGAAQVYFQSVERQEISPVGSVRLLSSPRHGTLEPRADAPGGYLYRPEADYFGPDRATFLVEMGGKKIRVEYFFRVLQGVADTYYEDKQYCPKGEYWKISLSRPNSEYLTFDVPSKL